MDDRPALIALDWGTSSLRAFLMGAGRVLQTRSSADGIQRVTGEAGFARALEAVAGDWRARWPELPLVACGMVGSAQGWREAPYVPCPADAAALARQAVAVDGAAGTRLLIAPGVRHDPKDAPPDVMRGEETQVLGALIERPELAARATLVLPGTHSKWVRVESGRIVALRTCLTGELFELLRTQSILGRLMPQEPPDAGAMADDRRAAFGQGVDAGRGGSLLQRLFAVRTLGLTGQLAPALLADYLSGLLIGSELDAMQDDGDAPSVLVGAPALCARYAEAFVRRGQAAPAVLDNTAPRGLWALATAAGLVAPEEEARC